jgi:serine/threonine protein kinase
VIQSAIDFLQDHGLIHRDVKPDNILYRSEHDVLDFALSDFGLAIVLKNAGPLDTERFYDMAGTPGEEFSYHRQIQTVLR